MRTDRKNPGSFRDPSGFLFIHEGTLYRQINARYRDDYDRLMDSGLYQALLDRGLLVSHQEVSATPAQSPEAYKVIQPQRIEFIGYPYEWCFSEFKAAALATLRIQRIALKHGMCLKDASAYNIQFMDGRPVFIDTLSFEQYHEGQPWVAYRQFCQHFLAPLALMSYTDIRLGQLLRVHIDGVPLDLAASLLPKRTKWRLGMLMHIHLHAKSQVRHANDTQGVKGRSVSRMGLVGLIGSLEKSVRKLTWAPAGTQWGDYYTFTNYSDQAFEQKKALVSEFIDAAAPAAAWDLGANTGLFSRLASEKGIPTVAFDIDPAAVEKNYRQIQSAREKNLLPLVQDLTNPSGGIGWAGCERDSLAGRGPVDLVMALALVHHLAISNNVPLEMIAEYLADLGRSLIIEFVPKEDSQVRKLLATREDVFPNYTSEGFETAFSGSFRIEKAMTIPGTERTLYLMRTPQK